MQSAVRIFVTWLAAWCQVIVVATMPLGPLAIGVDPLGNAPICHGGEDERQDAPTQPGQAGHDCILCIACQSHAGAVAILPPPPELPRLQALASIRLDAPRARAPPLHFISAAQPRGPPPLT